MNNLVFLLCLLMFNASAMFKQNLGDLPNKDINYLVTLYKKSKGAKEFDIVTEKIKRAIIVKCMKEGIRIDKYLKLLELDK